MAIEESAAFCVNCGTSLNVGVNFCPKCGQARETAYICTDCGTSLKDGLNFCPKCGLARKTALVAEPNALSDQTHGAPAPKKDYGKVGCAVVLLAILLFVGAMVSGVNERMGTAEVNSQNADVAVKMAERNMEDSFDSMEKIADAANSDALRIRIREIRLEWMEGKNDPNKLEVIKQKLDLLMKDVEANRYSKNASSETEINTLDSAESIAGMDFSVVNAGKGIKDYASEIKADYEAAQGNTNKLADFSNGISDGKVEFLIKADKSMSQQEKKLFRMNVTLIKMQTARESISMR